MKMNRVYDALARLLGYPAEDTLGVAELCQAALAETVPEAAALLVRFAEKVQGLTTEELQELYTQTFDLNPVCSLEVGWQLFGENYSRGEFLVAMRQILRRLGIAESTELPDHLTHVLPALGRMSPREANRFAARHLLPALDKMLHGLAGKNCPYEWVLAAIQAVVLSPYGAEMAEVAHG